MNLFAVVSKFSNVGNSKEWWVDTGATLHVCADKTMFSNCRELNGDQLFIGNSTSSKVEGKGKLI